MEEQIGGVNWESQAEWVLVSVFISIAAYFCSRYWLAIQMEKFHHFTEPSTRVSVQISKVIESHEGGAWPTDDQPLHNLGAEALHDFTTAKKLKALTRSNQPRPMAPNHS